MMKQLSRGALHSPRVQSPTDPDGAVPLHLLTSTMQTHAESNNLHITSSERTFLSALTVSAQSLNNVGNLTQNLSTLLNAKLDKTGGILSGPLELAANPITAMQAAPKQFVEQVVATQATALTTLINQRLALTGGTLTGPLILAGPPENLNEATTRSFVETTVNQHANNGDLHVTSAQKTMLSALTVGATELNYLTGLDFNVRNVVQGKLDLAGGTLTGALSLHANASSAMHAVPKQQLDAGLNTKLDKAGGVTTGFITLHAAPTAVMHAVNKQYVDDGLSAHASDVNLHLSAAERTWLSAINVSAATINMLGGLASNVQTQINERLSTITDGNLNANVTLINGKAIFSQRVPSSPYELVNKDYVDSRDTSKDWVDPVAAMRVVSIATNAPPVAPALHDAVIVGSAGTGAFAGKEGHLMVYRSFTQTDGNGVVTVTQGWQSVTGLPLEVGDRFGIGIGTTTAVGIVGETTNARKIVTVTNATPGAITYDEDDNVTVGCSTIVYGEHNGELGAIYSLTNSGNWVLTNPRSNNVYANGLVTSGAGVVSVDLGEGLKYQGNKVAVSLADNMPLAFTGGKLALNLNTAQLAVSGGQLGLTTATNNLIQGALQRAGGTVTGMVNFNAGLRTTAAPSVGADVVNFSYLGDVVTLLTDDIAANTTQIDTLTSAVAQKADSAATTSALNARLLKAGDTMTGFLTLHADPTSPMHAMTKQYGESILSTHATDNTIHVTAAQRTLLDNITASATQINYLSGVTSAVQTQLNARLPLAGGTMTGFITLHAAPTANMHPATKLYADTGLAARLPLAGGTMTGALVLAGAGATGTHQACSTSQMESAVSALSSSLTTQINSKLSLAGGLMTGALLSDVAVSAANQLVPKSYVDAAKASANSYTDGLFGPLNTLVGSHTLAIDSLTDDPTTQTALTTGLATKLNLAGGTMTGFITLHAAPTANMHPATKQYVDDLMLGISFKTSARVSTTAALAANYSNGSSGVGATLTATTNGAIVIDTVSLVAGDVVLVRHQATAAQNGLYRVTQVGSASAPYILTRSTTADENAELLRCFCFVYDGSATNKGTGWISSTPTPSSFAVGTSALTFTQFSGGGTYVQGNGISISGNAISAVVNANGTLALSAAGLSLATVGTAGSYRSVNTDAYGRVISGSNPTTLAGYGITDAVLNTTYTAAINSLTARIEDLESMLLTRM